MPSELALNVSFSSFGEDFAETFKSQIGCTFLTARLTLITSFQDINDLPGDYTLPEGRTKPWGTAHAIRAARSVINEPFAVINADDFYGRDSYVQIAKYLTDTTGANDGKDHYSMVGYKLVNTLSYHGNVNRGICKNTAGFLEAVEENTEIEREPDGAVRGKNLAGNRVEISEHTIASMNFWGFTPSIFEHIEKHFSKFLAERGTEMKSEYYIPNSCGRTSNIG